MTVWGSTIRGQICPEPYILACFRAKGFAEAEQIVSEARLRRRRAEDELVDQV